MSYCNRSQFKGLRPYSSILSSHRSVRARRQTSRGLRRKFVPGGVQRLPSPPRNGSNDDSDEAYFMDLYIPSCTPMPSAFIGSRKPGSQPERFQLLLAAQPRAETLPGAWREINVLEAVGSPVTTLVSEKMTPTTVIASRLAITDSFIFCHGESLTLLLEIVRFRLPAAEFAFLSTCHTSRR